MGPIRACFQIGIHALVRVVLRLFYGLDVPQSTPDDPCVIVANHNTHLDVFALFALVPLSRVPRLRAVAAADYFGKGFMGWLARFLFHVVLVDRSGHGHHTSPLQPAFDAVTAGDSLIVFPEGSRGDPGQIRPFKPGIGELAMHFPDLPIYPAALLGIERTMPRHRPIPVPFNITVRLCAPLRVAGTTLPEEHRAARQFIAGELQRRIQLALFPPTKAIRRVKAVSFDGDMTLWDFDKAMRHALARTLEEIRRRVPRSQAHELTVERMIEIRNEVAAELRGETVNLEEVRLRAFQRTLATIGDDDDALSAELNAMYRDARFEHTELYPDVLPALDAIGSRLRVGLLSNGNGYPDRCGLAGRFHFVLFSQEVGVEKPDPRMFLAACQEAGCKPEELLHVGDSLTCDVAGANGVGAISVWLNRDNAENDGTISPDYEITSLDSLLDLLGIDTPGPY
jgi:putative hydrolase of the HAD superfamily